MIITDLVSMVLRLAELTFAAIVVGLTGEYLHKRQKATAWDNGRHIYAITVAALSVLFALIWLFPFSGSFIHWPADLFFSILWFVVFGLLVNWLDGGCGNIWNWSSIRIRGDDFCAKQKAVVALAFLSAICWLVSAIVGAWWVRKRERRAAAASHAHTTHRRRWYRSRARV